MNKQRTAALAALIILILPLAAYAGHDHDDGDSQDQQVWHDNGQHKGWYKHHHQQHGDDDDAAAPPSPNTYPGRRVCDADGDHCHVVAPEPMVRPGWENHYVCDNDRDECRWTNGAGESYWHQNGGHDYGAPYSWYQAAPPSAYSLAQRRDWLVNRRKHAMVTINAMRHRGDSAAAGRMAEAVQVLDREIGAIDRKLHRGY